MMVKAMRCTDGSRLNSIEQPKAEMQQMHRQFKSEKGKRGRASQAFSPRLCYDLMPLGDIATKSKHRAFGRIRRIAMGCRGGLW